ncbi:PTS sugar transporter subunit IIB [Vibrio salinus]|uniref:PTS sugar transporter subunit IIB n=1 Tax=Vibrio salinus TaxID=2899784 RepID=UPI001E5BD1CA|nr:PTS sugar transporter subunit IIB [Vibrio salinus]MCE0493162.1 PTS sugar transporter subunit IIB [Vibrio salinus]
MTKILLCCAAGMSTSMVVKKMKQAAIDRNLSIEIEAVGLEDFEANLSLYDCFLLGPQINYKLSDFKAKTDAVGKPIAVINRMDYGMMKGAKILDDALALLQ